MRDRGQKSGVASAVFSTKRLLKREEQDAGGDAAAVRHGSTEAEASPRGEVHLSHAMRGLAFRGVGVAFADKIC